MKLKGDKRLRDRLMVPESYQHPAKGHLGLWEAIISKYTQPGDTILDPMAGVGSTLLAALMGRNVICVELEQHFVGPMRRSWEKMRTMPMLGCTIGQVVILRGDARCLPLPDGDGAEAIITSPPYEGIAVTAGDQARSPSILFPTGERTDRGKIKRDGLFEHGYTRPVDAVVTSPPFQTTEPWQDKSFEMHDGRKEPRRGALSHGYTRPAVAPWEVGNLTVGASAIPPLSASQGVDTIEQEEHEDLLGTQAVGYVDRDVLATRGTERPRERVERVDMPSSMRPNSSTVDAVITSPPFQERKAYEGQPLKPATQAIQQGGFATLPHAVSENMENIGNLRNTAYWEAMRLVYQECFRVLKPGGIMALVLKGFTRDGQYVDLPGQTEAMLLEAGWVKHDEWRRELWSLSFWRILQKRRDPAAFDDRLMYEEVLAFRRGP